MGDPIGCSLDCSTHEDGRGSIAVLNSWCGCWSLVLALQFVVFDLAICKAVEAPTVAELRRDHSELRTAVSNVQGGIRVFRLESVNPAALEKLPSDIGIPLIRSGSVWRSGERFRVDYKEYRPDSEVAKEFQHSLALDGGKVYELGSGTNPDDGALRVCDMDAPEAANIMRSIETMFCWHLDALWSADGTACVDVLQRPSTKIVRNKSETLPGGYSLLVSAGDGSEVQFKFEPAKNHPFGYSLASAGEGDRLVKAERRGFSIEKEGVLYPARVVNVVSLGPDAGYTEVAMLDLEPLDANSPIASGITSSSFRNLGIGYQVYNLRRSEKEEIAERYERPATFSSSGSGNNFRAYFLWANGFVILAILALVIFWYGRTNKRA